MLKILLASALLFVAAPLPAMDLALVRSEPKLERRSELALQNAAESLEEAKKAYGDSDFKVFEASMQELLESVELSYKSLQDIGKSARRSPKYFKRAELKTRDLARRLEGVSQSVEQEERAKVETVRQRVSQIQEQLLLSIMSNRKEKI